MPKSQYDAVIPNMGGSRFTGYYKKGMNLKLSDGTTVITVWKPECCPYYRGEVYKDAMIEISGNSTNIFAYQDMLKIGVAIEAAIDYLNAEKENLIDREKPVSYDHVLAPAKERKKTTAIKYADLQVGGVYLDDKKKKWIFLGKGTLLENGEQENRSNDGENYSEYMYMEFPEKPMKEIGVNTFKMDFFPYPDTYASKKRFFEKVGELPVTPDMPIIIRCGSTEYQACHGVKPKSCRELLEEMKGKGF